MKYTYGEGLERPRSWRWVMVPVLTIGVVLYGLADYFAPNIYYAVGPADYTANVLTNSRPASGQNKLYIPKINVTLDIVSSGQETGSFKQGVTERSSASGNPLDGGTYILAAQRFSLKLLPQQTRDASPFFHLANLSTDDDVYVDYKGKRYAYTVTASLAGGANRSDIEKRDSKAQLVLYADQPKGSEEISQAIKAKMIGEIIWSGNTPRLKSLE